MEEILKKVVNLGIGAAKTIEEDAKNFLSKSEAKINELISAGEQANDENSVKVKNFFEDASKNLKDIEGQIQTFTSDLKTKVQELNPNKGEGSAE